MEFVTVSLSPAINFATTRVPCCAQFVVTGRVGWHSPGRARMFVETAAITFGILGSLFAAVFSRIKDPQDIVTPASQKHKSSEERLTPQQLEEQVLEVADSLNLPKEQVKMYWSSFVKYDNDGSGAVDSSELKAMLLDTIGFQPSDEEITVMVSDVDADGNGQLEFVEFCQLAGRLDMGEQSAEDLNASFMMWSEGEKTISCASSTSPAAALRLPFMHASRHCRCRCLSHRVTCHQPWRTALATHARTPTRVPHSSAERRVARLSPRRSSLVACLLRFLLPPTVATRYNTR